MVMRTEALMCGCVKLLLRLLRCVYLQESVCMQVFVVWVWVQQAKRKPDKNEIQQQNGIIVADILEKINTNCTGTPYYSDNKATVFMMSPLAKRILLLLLRMAAERRTEGAVEVESWWWGGVCWAQAAVTSIKYFGRREREHQKTDEAVIWCSPSSFSLSPPSFSICLSHLFEQD